MWYKSTDPDAYEMSQVFQLWARSWAHARATCKSGGLTKEICREYGIELPRGDKTHLCQFLRSLRRILHPSLYCAKVKHPSPRGLFSRPPTEKPQQCRKLLTGSLTHIRRRMHRVSGRHPKKKNNVIGYVVGLGLQEREEISCFVAEKL